MENVNLNDVFMEIIVFLNKMKKSTKISFIDKKGKTVMTGKYSDMYRMIVKIRKEAKLTQTEVAKRMKISNQYICQVENQFKSAKHSVIVHPLWIKKYLMACGKDYIIEIK
jgi:DNA-binding XRE family transcriptional regulator